MVVEGYVDVVRLAQSGIAYAVATLGTATTPEHLNRLFRVTSEVVFCFDGDRAGRTAAWRALENALEHARDGRQLALPVPAGGPRSRHAGRRGRREAFEARIAGRHADLGVPGQAARRTTDLASVDGRARLAELARPLLARVPPGVYRELLLERLAAEVRMPAGRLARAAGGTEPARRAGSGGDPHAAPASVRARSAGRQPLLTQAIMLVLHHPCRGQGSGRDPGLARRRTQGLPGAARTARDRAGRTQAHDRTARRALARAARGRAPRRARGRGEPRRGRPGRRAGSSPPSSSGSGPSLGPASDSTNSSRCPGSGACRTRNRRNFKDFWAPGVSRPGVETDSDAFI